MKDQFSRLRLIYSDSDLDYLGKCKVAIFGIGGVGGYVVDGLARSGIKHFLLVDDDTVCVTNINRQLVANLETIGKYKVDVMKEHLLKINKDINVESRKRFFLPENSHEFDLTNYDYVIDAIDTVTAKIELIMKCKENNVNIISCMGCGNKVDPSKLEITDIYKTSVCPLAKVMRHELKNRRVKRLKVLYSKELPIKNNVVNETNCAYQDKCPKSNDCNKITKAPGSTSFVPASAGYLIASEVIKDLLTKKEEEKQ